MMRGYSAKREDIKNCFRMMDVTKTINPKALERDFLEGLSVFQQNLEHNLVEQLDSLRLEETDVTEVERLANITFNNYGSGLEAHQAAMMGRPRKKSMLPSRGKDNSFLMNPRKSMDLVAGNPLNFASDRGSPGRGGLQGFGEKSKSRDPTIGQYNSANPQFAVPDTGFNRNLNTSALLGGLRADIYLGEAPQGETGAERLTAKSGQPNQRTPNKPPRPFGYTKDVSPQQQIRRGIEGDEDDVDLLNSGLFDNGSKNRSRLLRNDRSKPTLAPASSNQLISNPASAIHSFYQTEVKDVNSQIGSVRDGPPNRFLTPHKTPSTSRLGGTRERTPERRGSRIDPDVSRISANILPSGGLTNRNATPTKNTRNLTPEKKARTKNFFDTEPLRSIMRSLDADTLPAFTLRNANLTDDLVSEICDRMQGKNTLRVLDLSYNSITDVGLARICEALSRTNVTNLVLSFNKITNEGLKTCFSLIRQPNNKVNNISIYPCQIEKTQEGRKQISDAFAKKGVILKF